MHAGPELELWLANQRIDAWLEERRRHRLAVDANRAPRIRAPARAVRHEIHHRGRPEPAIVSSRARPADATDGNPQRRSARENGEAVLQFSLNTAAVDLGGGPTNNMNPAARGFVMTTLMAQLHDHVGVRNFGRTCTLLAAEADGDGLTIPREFHGGCRLT
jgi:hypothetical protein